MLRPRLLQRAVGQQPEDYLFGVSAKGRPRTRQALHATRLALVHPVTNTEIVWEAPLPQDMGQAWSELAKSPQLPIRGA